jgi:integrase
MRKNVKRQRTWSAGLLPENAVVVTWPNVWSAVRLQGKARSEKTSLRKCIRPWVEHSAHGQDELRAYLSLLVGTVLAKIIQPAAVRAGICKKVGWHTFRHTYSTLLVGNGENVKVVQELMRHAKAWTTLDLYTLRAFY